MQSCSVAIHYNSPGSKLAAGTTKNAINARGGDAEVFQADLTKVSSLLPTSGGEIKTAQACCCSGLSSSYQRMRHGTNGIWHPLKLLVQRNVITIRT